VIVLEKELPLTMGDSFRFLILKVPLLDVPITLK